MSETITRLRTVPYDGSKMFIYTDQRFSDVRVVYVDGTAWVSADDIVRCIGKDTADTDKYLSKYVSRGNMLRVCDDPRSNPNIVDGYIPDWDLAIGTTEARFPYDRLPTGEAIRIAWITKQGVAELLYAFNETHSDFGHWVVDCIFDEINKYTNLTVTDYLKLEDENAELYARLQDNQYRLIPKKDGPFMRFIENKHRTR